MHDTCLTHVVHVDERISHMGYPPQQRCPPTVVAFSDAGTHLAHSSVQCKTLRRHAWRRFLRLTQAVFLEAKCGALGQNPRLSLWSYLIDMHTACRCHNSGCRTNAATAAALKRLQEGGRFEPTARVHLKRLQVTAAALSLQPEAGRSAFGFFEGMYSCRCSQPTSLRLCVRFCEGARKGRLLSCSTTVPLFSPKQCLSLRCCRRSGRVRRRRRPVGRGSARSSWMTRRRMPWRTGAVPTHHPRRALRQSEVRVRIKGIGMALLASLIPTRC